MSNEDKKHAADFWVYCDFGRVVKFLDSIYPRIPTMKDKINFWKLHGSYRYKKQPHEKRKRSRQGNIH